MERGLREVGRKLRAVALVVAWVSAVVAGLSLAAPGSLSFARVTAEGAFERVWFVAVEARLDEPAPGWRLGAAGVPVAGLPEMAAAIAATDRRPRALEP